MDTLGSNHSSLCHSCKQVRRARLTPRIDTARMGGANKQVQSLLSRSRKELKDVGFSILDQHGPLRGGERLLDSAHGLKPFVALFVGIGTLSSLFGDAGLVGIARPAALMQ